MSEFRPTKRAVLALILALAGFVVQIGESGQTIEGGRVTESYEYNYAAVLLGAVAIVVAVVEGVRLARGGERRLSGPPVVHLAFLGIVVLLGLYQVLLGSDVL